MWASLCVIVCKSSNVTGSKSSMHNTLDTSECMAQCHSVHASPTKRVRLGGRFALYFAKRLGVFYAIVRSSHCLRMCVSVWCECSLTLIEHTRTQSMLASKPPPRLSTHRRTQVKVDYCGVRTLEPGRNAIQTGPPLYPPTICNICFRLNTCATCVL